MGNDIERRMLWIACQTVGLFSGGPGKHLEIAERIAAIEHYLDYRLFNGGPFIAALLRELRD